MQILFCIFQIYAFFYNFIINVRVHFLLLNRYDKFKGYSINEVVPMFSWGDPSFNKEELYFYLFLSIFIGIQIIRVKKIKNHKLYLIVLMLILLEFFISYFRPFFNFQDNSYSNNHKYYIAISIIQLIGLHLLVLKINKLEINDGKTIF
jgi:hypothetical protein